MSEEYHIVVRQGKPYIRRKPYHYENPTLRQQVHQGRFAKVASEQFDKAKGYRDGIPVVAAEVKESLKEKTVLAHPPRTLELTPFQYAVLLDQIRRRQVKGEKVVLVDLLAARNIRIKIVVPIPIEVTAE